MSWLRNSSLRASFGPKRQFNSPPKECDPVACMESFKKHWQQASEIIQRTQAPVGYPIHDDVLGVVNHLSQMVTLLVIELRQTNKEEAPATPTPCLEHLLSETILDRLFNWSIHTGRFSSVVKKEQFKLYELLVSHSGQQLLVHEPFLKPLLKLLASCAGEVFPVEVEKHLVLLLNQLCVSLMQNIQLLDLFFYSSNEETPRFMLFSLLIPYVHREGAIGQQARDSLLLCMSMSKKNEYIANYISEHSNVCPVLATGLSGLYSVLPRKLEIETDDWHRFTPDDVTEVPEFMLFMNSIEFCNAVAQVAHESVRNQLLEFLYQGFLVPVMGPALLQSTVEELVAATAYYELFLRSATNPGLMQTLTRFLLCDCYDGQRILNTLISRISSPSRLSLVTLALLETLVSLDSEEVMYELVLKHLLPCSHVMLSQRRRLREVDPYTPSAIRFLSLAPSCGQLKQTQSNQSQSTHSLPVSQTHVYGLRPEESLYGNYHAYLCDARYKIEMCAKNCSAWRHSYDGVGNPEFIKCMINNDSTNKSKSSAIDGCDSKEDDLGVSLVSVDGSSGYESFALGKCSAETTPENEPNETEDGSGSAQDTTTLTKSIPLDVFNSTPTVGPFLNALLTLLEKMPKQSLYVNLRLTGIISRLAVYPHPLLASFLLNHSLVFQPSIRSLFQILGSLKQKLDGVLNKYEMEELVSDARQFLLTREDKLANMRKTAVEAHVSKKNTFDSLRDEPKKKSFSSTLISVLGLSLNSSTPAAIEDVLTSTNNGTYRYIRRSKGDISKEEELRNMVMCAVVLDEWLKELSAIAQEHTLFSISS